MTKKEATNLMYNTLEDSNFVEDIVHDNNEFLIYKSFEKDEYMVCKLFEEDKGLVSDIFDNIEDCHNWINQNLQ